MAFGMGGIGGQIGGGLLASLIGNLLGGLGGGGGTQASNIAQANTAGQKYLDELFDIIHTQHKGGAVVDAAAMVRELGEFASGLPAYVALNKHLNSLPKGSPEREAVQTAEKQAKVLMHAQFKNLVAATAGQTLWEPPVPTAPPVATEP